MKNEECVSSQDQNTQADLPSNFYNESSESVIMSFPKRDTEAILPETVKKIKTPNKSIKILNSVAMDGVWESESPVRLVLFTLYMLTQIYSLILVYIHT